jgi:hypothetical protein
VISIPKIMGVVSCGAVLCLSLSTAAQAERMKDPCTERKTGMHSILNCDKDAQKGIDTIKGEVFGVEGGNLVIEEFNGRETRLHADANTQTDESVSRGDWVEAKVKDENDGKHVLSIHHIK